jgi:RNA polymerase sigma-70 factor (ECF subfamily)
MSTALLTGLRAHEAEAWQRMVGLYGPVIYGWCKRQGLQPSDAEDVVQEVFRAVLARIADFRRRRPADTFRGWLWTITRNKLGDYMRRCATQPRPVGGSEAHERLEQVPVPLSVETAEEGPAALSGVCHRALDLIRDEYETPTWQAFWQVVGEGRKPAEVALDLGLSLNAVYLAKSRVLRRLREVLGDVPED